MGKAGAIGWPDGIDAAFIVLEVKELTGVEPVHPIPIAAVLLQPLLLKRVHRHAQVFGNPFHVLACIGRGHGLTAIGTGKAIHFLPNLFFSRGGPFVQFTGCVLFQAGKETFIGCLSVSDFLFKGPKVYRHKGGCLLKRRR